MPLALFTFARLARGADRRDWLLVAPFLADVALREPGLVGNRLFFFFEGGLGLTCIAFLFLIALHLRGAQTLRPSSRALQTDRTRRQPTGSESRARDLQRGDP